jgi:hypothetical protein
MDSLNFNLQSKKTANAGKKAVSQNTLKTRNCNCQSVIPTNSNGTTLIKYKIKYVGTNKG